MLPARAGHGVNHFLHNHWARFVNAGLAVCVRQLANVLLFAQSQIIFRQYFGTDGCHLIEERQARYARCLRPSQCLLRVETCRAVPALFDFSFGIQETVILYCHSGACSKWRQGSARITGLYEFFVDRTLPVTIIVTTMLAPNGDRACPHCSICCLFTMMFAPCGDRVVPASLYCLICVPTTLMVMVQ